MAGDARDVAVNALMDRDGNVSARVRRLVRAADLRQEGKSLASELALGTLRHKRTLDVVMKCFLARPQRRLPRILSEILKVALYQIIFLDRVPDHAAVNEAVRQADDFGHKRQSGLVNGLLRTVLRNLSEPVAGRSPLAVDAIPTGPGSHRKSERPIFSNPDTSPADYLAEAYSLPDELAAAWLNRSGSLIAAVKLAEQAGARAPRIVRVNTLKCTVDQAAESMRAEGAEVQLHENGRSLVVVPENSLLDLTAFVDGIIQPQDATATAVSLAMDIKAGMSVLDFCAAPGTKTVHMAELLGDSGSITACDVNEDKLSRIREGCERMGVSSVKTMLANKVGSLEPESFDRVLADVPCSNTGVLARRPEARWRFSNEAISRLVKDQKDILSIAAIFVKPGGKLVYSTCSIEPAECDQVAKWLVKRDRRLRLIRDEYTMPGGAGEPARWCDGGYLAVFQA